MDNSDNLKGMEQEKRFSLMEATMKENGLKIKNQERSVKNSKTTKIYYTQDHLMTIKNQAKVNYWTFKNKLYMMESFQTIKKKENSK